MANRVLTSYSDHREEVLEDGELHRVGMGTTIEIERMASGAPSIQVITRMEDGLTWSEHCILIPDARAFLAPVLLWLAENGEPLYVRELEGLLRA